MAQDLDSAAARVRRIWEGENRYVVYQCDEAGETHFAEHRYIADLETIARTIVPGIPPRAKRKKK